MTKTKNKKVNNFVRAKPSRKIQDEMIMDEINRLKSIFVDLPENKKMITSELIERVAFMTVQMRVLENTIKMKGPTYLFKNGSQEMLLENPAQKSYNTTMNRYTAAYNILFNLLNELDGNNDSYQDI